MGKQLPTPAVKDTLPGPADYALRPHSAVSLSITPRRMKEKGTRVAHVLIKIYSQEVADTEQCNVETPHGRVQDTVWGLQWSSLLACMTPQL